MHSTHHGSLDINSVPSPKFTATDKQSESSEDFELAVETQLIEADDIRTKYAETISNLLQNYKSALQSTGAVKYQQIEQLWPETQPQLEQLQLKALSRAVEISRLAIQEDASSAEQRQRQTIDATIEKIRNAAHVEIKRLKKRHQDAVAQIRTTTQKQLESQRADLEEKYFMDLKSVVKEERLAGEQRIEMEMCARKDEISQVRGSLTAQLASLQLRYEQGEQQHQVDLLQLESEFRSRLADAEAETQEQNSSVVSSQNEFLRAELTAMQERLDTSLTSQAETERSLAVLRQQKSEVDPREEELKSLRDRLKYMAQENEHLRRKKHQQRQTSLQEFHPRLSMDASTPTASPVEELGSLKIQMANIEQERSEAQNSLQKALDEKSETSRQNEFLIKELEAALTRRARPSVPTGTRVDAAVQTDALISEPKSDSAPMQPVKAGLQGTIHLVKSSDTANASVTLPARKMLEQLYMLRAAKNQLVSKHEKEFAGTTRDNHMKFQKKSHQRLIPENPQISLNSESEFHQLTENYEQKIIELLKQTAMIEAVPLLPTNECQRILNELEMLCTRLESAMFRGFKGTPETVRASRETDDGVAFNERSVTSNEALRSSQNYKRTSSPRTALATPRVVSNVMMRSSYEVIDNSRLSNSILEEDHSEGFSPLTESPPILAEHLSEFPSVPQRVKSEPWVSIQRSPPSPVKEDPAEEMHARPQGFERSNSERLIERTSRASLNRIVHKRISSKRLSSGLIYYQPPRQSRPISLDA